MILWVLETTRSAPRRGHAVAAMSRMRDGRPRPRPRPAARHAHVPPPQGPPHRRSRRSRWATRPSLRGPGRSCQRAIERLGRDAVGDAELRVDLRGHENRPEARHDEPVDRARVHVALHHDLLAALRERHACSVVALRGPVDQEPRAGGAPRLRRKLLGPLERRRLRAGVDALRERRDEELQRSLPERLCQHRVRRIAALVTGDVQTPRRARGVRSQGVEIGRLRLHAFLRHRSECTEGEGAIDYIITASVPLTHRTCGDRAGCGGVRCHRVWRRWQWGERWWPWSGHDHGGAVAGRLGHPLSALLVRPPARLRGLRRRHGTRSRSGSTSRPGS